MMISKFIWFWQAGFYKRAGWWVDGGIWPRLRVVREARLEDYFYRDDDMELTDNRRLRFGGTFGRS